MRKLFYIILLVFANLLCYADNNALDSLKNIINNQTGLKKAITLITYSENIRKKQPKEAIENLKEAIQIAERFNNINLKAEAIHWLGSSYFYHARVYPNENADENIQKAIETWKSLVNDNTQGLDRKWSSQSSWGIGYTYLKMLNEIDNAIFYFQTSLEISESIGDSINVANAINSLGGVYYEIHQDTIALEYYERALKYAREFNQSLQIVNILMNMASIEARNKKYDNALTNFNEVLRLTDSIRYSLGKIQVLNLIGNLYVNKEDYDKAFNVFEEAEKLCIYENETGILTKVYGNLGNVSRKKKDFNSAISFYNKCILLANENNNKIDESIAYKGLSEVYEDQKNYKKALEKYKRHTEINDSVFKSDLSSSLAEMKIKYETAKTEKALQAQKFELEKKQKENEAQQKENEVQQKILVGVGIAGGVLLVLVLMVFAQYRQKKRANILLENQNIEIQQQSEEIQAQAEQLELTNRELEKLSIVARETDNSVIIADNEGNIEWVNVGFSRLFGYTLDEYVSVFGRNILEVSSYDNIKLALKECIEEGRSHVYSAQNKTKSGKVIWAQTTLTPIMGPDGKLFKLVAIDSDITKIKEAEAEVEKQRIIAVEQRDQIGEQKKHIMDSIHYAKRIQSAILNANNFPDQNIKDHFILFMPRDIVSGDFYWFNEKNGRSVIAAADCTGHGVPGAFMSMIGTTFLNDIVMEQEITTPGLILDNLREDIIKALGQTGKDGEAKDGMDIALFSLDWENKKLEFSGANNPLYLIKKGAEEVIELSANRMPIGISHKQEAHFENHVIDVCEGDTIYIFSDGYVDQFGGPKGKKYLAKRFQMLLLSIQDKTLEEQSKILHEKHLNWKGELEQVDDIIVIGVRL